MSFNLGINLVEVDGATPSIQGAPTSVAGFVIRSQRGVPNVVRQISTFNQFTDYFGGYVNGKDPNNIQTSYVGAYAIRGFFDNGGSLAYVLRIVDETVAVAASASVASVAASGAVTVITATAAYRGTLDPGTWGQSFAILVAANTSNRKVTDAFDLTVGQAAVVNGVPTYKPIETWSRLSPSGKGGYQQPSALNDPNTGSKYVQYSTTTVGAAATWALNTTYAAGTILINGGNVYKAVTGGASSNGPAGTTAQSPISDGTVTWYFIPTGTAPAWANSTSYGLGTVVTNSSNTYVAIVGGKSAGGSATGPTGTGASFIDGGVTWAFVPTTAPPAWASDHAYTAGTMASNGGNNYVATTAGTSTTGPAGTSTTIVDGGVTWAYVPAFVPAGFVGPAWQAGQHYNVGNLVGNGGNVYLVTAAGTSGGPVGTTASSAITSDGNVTWYFIPTTTPSAWASGHSYPVGSVVTSASNTYIAIVGGTSASGNTATGPTGTAASITDGTGTTAVTWAYVPATPSPWASAHAYTAGTVVTNGGNNYVVTNAGTSGAGPTGTGTTITDGNVTWTIYAPSYSPLANGKDDPLAASSDPTSPGTLDTWVTEALSVPSPFNPYPIELLACPESSAYEVVEQALTYCSNRGDCMFVGHVPDYGQQPLAAAKVYGQKLQQDKAYGALYLPYIQVADPLGTLVWIPPTGHVLGVYARTDQQRGIWKAPAGDAALVNNALDVRATLNDTDHTDLVKNGSVNAIRPITGAGIVIDSSRTLSTNTLWLYVNVRLLFNYVKTSLKLGLRWVVQEPNSSDLWNKIKVLSVTPFLMGLWRRGAFGPGAPADVFTVKVDADNNPPANIQQGILNVEVYFYPSRPAETIIITVGQQEGAASASES